MIHDTPDYDAAIALATKARDRAQAAFDAIKYSGDSSRIIDLKFVLDGANRRVVELRGEKAAAQRLESVRSSAIFYGSNS